MHSLRYHEYILVGDEPAVFSETVRQSFAQWFSEGFSRYFVVYPEWFSPITNFSRPMMNIVPYLNYLCFGRDFELYYLAFFASQLCGALMMSYLMRAADVPLGWSLFFVALFVFNPAFVNFGLVMIPYQFDVLASIFALAAFLTLWKGFYYLTVVMLLLAVFTKETALFAPIAAAITVFLWTRRAPLAAMMLAPFVLWAMLRLATYGTISGGTYAGAPGLWGALASFVAGMVVWPTGVIPGSGGLLRLVSGSMQPSSVVYAAVIMFNGVLWMFLTYSGWLIAKRLVSERAHYLDDHIRLVAGLIIWAFGALGFCVILGLVESRYGASVYAFLFLLLAVLMFGGKGFRLVTPTTWLVRGIVLMLAIVCVWSATTFFTSTLPVFTAEVSRQRALYDALRTLQQDGQTVSVVNAPGALGSAPQFLKTAWNVDLNVVFVNQVTGCTKFLSFNGDNLEQKSGGMLEVRIPECADYKFANSDEGLLAAGIQGELERSGVGRYHFPEGRIVGHWSNNPAVPKVDFGHVMQVRLAHDDALILAYDWNDGRYKVHQAESRSRSE